MEFIDVSAKTIEEAIARGVAQLAESGKELVETEVIEKPSSGFLGIGRKPAVVRLYFTAIASNATHEEEVAIVEQSVVEAEHIHGDEDVVEPMEEKKEEPEVDRDLIAQKGKTFLEDMFQKMGLSVMIEKMITADKITFQIHGDEVGILIGKHGQTLDAIQYLTNLVAHKDVVGRCHIIVDVESYRARREQTLISLAKRLASKVKRTRRSVSLEPMNAFERKIIHTALQKDNAVITDSEGEEPYRHVVISYKK